MKNAFEIRLEILQMAHSDMNQMFQEKLQVYRTRDIKGNTINPSEEIIEKLFPKPLEIIKRAEELYTFVEDKGL
jgi:arsenate reductase-like glutaredoxin family protein